VTWPENNSVSSGDKIIVGTAIGECVLLYTSAAVSV
jgi:hypothetical protein